jgi:hypothetical protein
MQRWIQTYTGKKFNLECPSEEMICIEDIAHHLALENRFGGATILPYSVAEHSIEMCKLAPEELKLEALLHDAEEAYYKDLPTPLKRLIRDEIATNLWDRTIHWFRGILAEKYKLSRDEYHLIKEMNLRMALTERNILLGMIPEQWDFDKMGLEPFPITLRLGRSFIAVEAEFLGLYLKYKRT